VSRVELGRIVKPHGLRGELVLAGVRLSPEELLHVSQVVARAKDGAVRPLTVQATRPFMQGMLVRFEGIEDVDEARTLHGHVLEVDPARLPPPEDGTVYFFQLVGLAVFEGDLELGKVSDVMQTGAAPILVVRGERERMIPMSMVREVDTAGGRVTVELLAGMEDL